LTTGFTVQLTRAGARDLDRVPSVHREQVIEDIQGLQQSPLGPPPRIKRLRGLSSPLFRLRSGDYRILYRVDDTLVTVMRVINRRDLDRALRQLGLGSP
jgi:mRNA interferase RelE/StbE